MCVDLRTAGKPESDGMAMKKKRVWEPGNARIE